MDKDSPQPVRTFRPGALISVEGERARTHFLIDVGVVEESIGHQILGRREAGDVVPRSNRGIASVTTRALTQVRAHELAPE